MSAVSLPDRNQKAPHKRGFSSVYKKKKSSSEDDDFWRCHPESNWGSRSCSPLPYRLAMAPYGADDEARTRYLHLGKVALYQMSYIRKLWCLRAESNHRHGDFQSPALPTELQRQVSVRQLYDYIILLSVCQAFFTRLRKFFIPVHHPKTMNRNEVAGDPERARTVDL